MPRPTKPRFVQCGPLSDIFKPRGIPARELEEVVLPVVKKLKLKGESKKYVQILENNLEDLSSSFGKKITESKVKLSPREVEICNMIKEGLSSKEISS